MKRIWLIFFLLQFSILSVFSESVQGRKITPYLKCIGVYNYIVKCKVIDYTLDNQSPRELTALRIVIVDKLNQNLPDTLWVKAWGLAGTTIDYKDFETLYYIVLKLKDDELLSNFSDPESMLKIDNGKVYAKFTAFDVFLAHLLHLKKYRKMKIERFEKIVMEKIGKR